MYFNKTMLVQFSVFDECVAINFNSLLAILVNDSIKSYSMCENRLYSVSYYV